MTRKLTKEEIENMLKFITPQPSVPLDTAMSVVKINKANFRKQLEKEEIYPNMIPMLGKEIEKVYRNSLIQAGESVGVICAQSIGEKQTQCTLNSIDWKDNIMYTKDSSMVIEPIGKMIDELLTKYPTQIKNIDENRTEYLAIPPEDGEYKIPASDSDGRVKWYNIEAVTKHLPVGKLVRITTYSGRKVTATQSKSFLVWDGNNFVGTLGSDIKRGDIVPTTSILSKPILKQKNLDVRRFFPKDEYVYTTEIIKARILSRILPKSKNMEKWWRKNNGKSFILPFLNHKSLFSSNVKRLAFYESCNAGHIYIPYSTNISMSCCIPEELLLDIDFGFVIGLWLAEGLLLSRSSLIFLTSDHNLQHRLIEYFKRYRLKYEIFHKKHSSGPITRIEFYSRLFVRLFQTLSKKHVPDFCYTAPHEFIEGLIDGYFSYKGLVNPKYMSIKIVASSKDLVLGLSSLLSYYGVFGRICVQKNQYILCISSKYTEKFTLAFTISENFKQKTLNEFLYAYSNYVYVEEFPSDRDVYFDTVVSVEMVEGTTDFVYDLTVKGPRNFQLWNGLNIVDTFHRAGQSEKTMTSGVPRFQELINATKKPRIVNHRIYFNKSHYTVEDLRETVRDNIVGLTFKDISTKISVELNKKEETWYKTYAILYGSSFLNYSHCISFKLNMNKIFEFKISLEKLIRFIHNKFDDLHCVFSPNSKAQLDIFIDCQNMELPEERILFVDSSNAVEIYLEECVQPVLENMNLCGIQGITEVFYIREDKQWIVETNGINSRQINNRYKNYKTLLALDIVDSTRTISNNVWDIYEVLGIEAARQFLIEELLSILDGINPCHPYLLVDRMTHGGSISSITRYTMKKAESGPFGKASFEETHDNFLNAAARGEIEPTKGVSASIICGKRSNIGTGMVGIRIDLNRLPKTIQETHNDLDSTLQDEDLEYLEQQSLNTTIVSLPQDQPLMVEI